MRQPNNKKGPEGMAKVNKDVVKRLMSYIGHYKLRFAAVLICIVVNALAMVSCSLSVSYTHLTLPTKLEV